MAISLQKTSHQHLFVPVALILAILTGGIISHHYLVKAPLVKADGINSTDFVLTIKTDNVATGSSLDTQFRIPTRTGYTYNYTVDCGNDGVHEVTGLTSAYTCTFPQPGTYKIRIGGTFPAIYFNNAGEKLKLLEINQWGTGAWRTMNNSFYGCEHMDLKTAIGDAPNLSLVTDMSGMFRGAKNLVGAGSEWTWNTSSVTSMNSLFSGALLFNQDITSWNVSNVTNIGAMFQNTPFNQPIGSWNTSKVTNMVATFGDTPAFNQNINSWSTANVTSMASMFQNAKAFNQPIGSWNTGSVLSMHRMFSGATSFNQDINTWNTVNVTNMGEIFRSASSFNQPLSNWNTSKITSMANMFTGASSFNQDISSWNTANVTTMLGMFQGASSFNQPLNSWDTRSLTSTQGMFNGASSFNQDLDNWDMADVTTMRDMFGNASAFNGRVDGWDTSNVTSMYYMFSGAQSFNQPVNSWNTSKVTSMARMFQGCHVFNQPLDNWDVSKVVDANSMFRDNYAFNQPLNSWDTSSLVTTYGMFTTASSFNQPLDNWNTSNVTNMGNTFNGAYSFNQPLNSWDTSKVTTMFQMFVYASEFNQPLDSWSTTLVTDMRYMFYYAQKFNQSLEDWDVSSLARATDMFWGAHSMSTVNYDRTLNSWSTQSLQPSTNFSWNSTSYCLAENSRQSMIDSFGWTIVDDGKDCAEYRPTSLTYQGITTVEERSDLPLLLGSVAAAGDVTGFSGSYTYSLTCEQPGVNDSLFAMSSDGQRLELVAPVSYDEFSSIEVCVRTTDEFGQVYDHTMQFGVEDLFFVSYDDNDAAGDFAPFSSSGYRIGDRVTILGSASMVRDGYRFIGWNESPDGSGNSYTEGDSIIIRDNLKLYAQWERVDDETDVVASQRLSDTGDGLATAIVLGVSSAVVGVLTILGSVFRQKA